MKVTRNFTDDELIKNLQTGSQRDEAIRFIYKEYFGSLSWFVMNNQGNLQDAEDIFQEVVVNFISLVGLKKFRGESSVKTFLFSLNRYTWLNELKRKGRASTRELNYENLKDRIDIDVSIHMIEKESTLQIFALVEQLGENCKKILLLFYYENLAVKDILEQLDYENEQVVRNKKYKCLKQLEKMITGNPALKQTLKNLLNG